MEFQEKFIGFVDILGFKELVKAAENGTGRSLSQLLDLLKILGSPEDRNDYEEHGPTTCPGSKCIQRNLDFRVTQISDCVIVSSEVSPAGVINLICHLGRAVIGLLEKGMMCRGYISKGKVYHTDNQIIGPAYQEAVENEKVVGFMQGGGNSGTPFVEINSVVSDYIRDCKDSCVKKFFWRHVKKDGDMLALFPFQMLYPRLDIFETFGERLGSFDPVEGKQEIQNVRDIIDSMKNQVTSYADPENEAVVQKTKRCIRASVVQKTKLYIRALDEQLKECDRMDDQVDKFFPSSEQNSDDE